MNPQKIVNENKLISLLNAGDVNAFDTLFFKYHNNIYNFSFSILKDSDDSKEIIQETFLKIWKYRLHIDSSKSFKSFLFTISYRLIIDRLRLKMKEKEYLSYESVDLHSELLIVEYNHDFTILAKHIENAVKELPEKRRSIYQLSREKGLSHKEISAELGITTKTVENQINMALKHLKSKLGEDVTQYY